MKKSTLHIVHHDTRTPEMITTLLESGKVGISPHIGNMDTMINPGYLQIITHVGGLTIELVDSVKLDDKDFHPKMISARSAIPKHLANKDTGKVHLASNKHNNRMAGSHVFKVPDHITDVILPCGSPGMSIAELHMRSVGLVAHPDSVVETSSQMFSRAGEIATCVMRHASALVPRPMRMVDQDGVISTVTKHDIAMPIFGLDGSDTGLLAPVEALMACEAIVAAIKGETISHIGGSAMFGQYTRDPNVMEPVADIFRLVTEGDLGVNVAIDYSVLNKADLATRLPGLGDHVLTQYDLIHERMAVS